MKTGVQIGFAQACINPLFPVRLCGYGKERWCTEVHDDLYVQAIVMRNYEEKVQENAKGESENPNESNNNPWIVWLSLDTLAVDDGFTQAVQTRLQSLQILPHHILVSATHTHSGPSGLCHTNHSVLHGLEHTFGVLDEAYREFVLNQILDCVKLAVENHQFGEIAGARGEVDGVGGERHGRNKRPMPISTLEFSFPNTEAKPIVLVTLACHPTILNADNVLLSADLPYGVRDALNDHYAMVMVVNGAAGDQSTRFFRQSSSFDEVNRMGKRIADKILDMRTVAIKEMGGLQINAHTFYPQKKVWMNPYESKERLDLAILNLHKAKEDAKTTRETTTKEEFGTELPMLNTSIDIANGNIRLLETMVDGARANFDLMQHLDKIDSLQFSIVRLAVCSMVFVGVPGELAMSLKRLVQKDYDIVGYTNGYYLYIVDEESYEHGDYEAMSSPLAKGEGERLMKFIQEII